MKRTSFGLTLAAVLIAVSAPFSQASLLISEPFDYSTGNLAGQTGGIGFTGNWTTVGDAGGAIVQAGSLAYSTLATSGNKTYVSPNVAASGASRTFSNMSSGTVYMSFLINHDEGTRFFALRLYDGAAERLLIGQGTAGTTWLLGGSTVGFTGDTGVAASLDTTFLMVLRIDFDASGTNERLRLYVNPTLGTEPLTAQADGTTTSSFQLNKLDIAGGQTGGGNTVSKGWFDEIRFGTTFADVTPVPEPATWALLSLGGIAGLFFRRRRIG
jgi:hypothetical protein